MEGDEGLSATVQVGLGHAPAQVQLHHPTLVFFDQMQFLRAGHFPCPDQAPEHNDHDQRKQREIRRVEAHVSSVCKCVFRTFDFKQHDSLHENMILRCNHFISDAASLSWIMKRLKVNLAVMLMLTFGQPIARATNQMQIPSFKNPKHEIGYVCLKDVQDENCYSKFARFDEGGNQLDGDLPTPHWAKKADGQVLTREEWDMLIFSVTGYDHSAFAVYSTKGEMIELRSSGQTQQISAWVPKAKIRSFTPLEDLPFCAVTGDSWWKKIYRADLKTPAGIDLTKGIPGDPFRGEEPIGILTVRRNNQSEICSAGACRRAIVAVDPKLFQVPDAMASRATVIQELNLGFEHFLGTVDLSAEAFGSKFSTNHLAVFDRRGSSEFLLQTSIYNKPKVWIKIPDNLRDGIVFHKRASDIAKKALENILPGFHYPSEGFLRGAPISFKGSQWKDGRLWVEAEIMFTDFCSGEPTIKKSYGTYWLPYGDAKFGLCPKGC